MAKKKTNQKKKVNKSVAKKIADDKLKKTAKVKEQKAITKNNKKTTKKNKEKAIVKKPTQPKKEIKPDKKIIETKKDAVSLVSLNQKNDSTPDSKPLIQPDFTKIKNNIKVALPAIIGVLAIVFFAVLNFHLIPNVALTLTDDFKENQKREEAKALSEEKSARLQERIAIEDEILNFDENQIWKLEMEIADFGVLEIESKIDFSPKNVENFIRLVYRGFYNDTSFDRIIKQENFNIIQGGSEKNTNQGKSAFFVDDQQPGHLSSDLWKVEPEFSVKDDKNVVTNEPKLNFPDLYGDFDPDTGTLIYPKGLLVAYSDSGPDSISSQFFITLSETKTPAEFPAFARISESSFKVLEKIKNEVNSQQNDSGFDTNIPNKEIRIKEIRIIDPSV